MSNPAASNCRILIIDDNERIHEDFRKILAGDSTSSAMSEDEALLFGDDSAASGDGGADEFQVEDAMQGQEGFEMVKAAVEEGRPYAMAFVDMRMPPGWDGVETIEHLWQVDPALQVVICTAYSDYSWKETIDRLGQTDRLLILKKPFDVAEVSQLAASLTRKWEMQRQLKERMDEMEEAVALRTRELQQARDDSERLLGAISSLLIEVDAKLIVRRWNIQAEELFGISVDEALGKCFADLPIEWNDPAEAEALVDCSNSTHALRTEIEFCDSAGTRRVLGISKYRVEVEGAARGALLLGTDLTEQRALETQLNAAQKLEAVGQLAAGVAHEINTPLQYVGDNLQYLKSSFEKVIAPLDVCLKLVKAEQGEIQLDEVVEELNSCMKPRKLKSLVEQVPEAIEDSADGVQTVSRIVRAMKEFSHPGAEEKTPVDLNHALETTLTVSRNEWKYVADAETDFDPNVSNVMAFPGELNQVFLNLVVNGAHAIIDRFGDDGSQKGCITVGTKAGDGVVEVRISDTGSGIPEHAQDRVFDPFFTTKEVGKGTGQGLAIAYDVVVNKHGGAIRFETEANVGTTFIISLPLADPATREDAETEPATAIA